MKNILAIAALGCGVAAMLTGCANASDAEPGQSENTLRVFAVELPGDRSVDCIASKYTSNLTDPDCNWASVRDGAPSLTEKENSSLQSYTVKLEDGQKVICVGSIYESNAVSPDCDWDSLNKGQ